MFLQYPRPSQKVSQPAPPPEAGGNVPFSVKRWFFVGVALTSLNAAVAIAQEARDLGAEASRERIEQLRREQNQRPALLTPAKQSTWKEPLDGESPCFAVDQFEITADNVKADSHGWLLRNLGAFRTACFGPGNVELLRTNLQTRLMERGFVTSSLQVPPQSLASGMLRFELRLGRVEAVVFESANDAATGASQTNVPTPRAVGLQPGAVLNLRDIEQALENLSKLPSQNPQFRIEPGNLPDTSRIVIATAGGRRWRGNLNFESTESPDYGPLASTLGLSFDAPLGISDQLSASVTGSMHHHGSERPTQTSLFVSYSVPLGAHALSVNVSRSDHKRSIQGGVSQFSESGSDTQAHARWQWTAWRNPSARASVWAGLSAKRSRAYIEDTELLLRRRNASSAEAGASLYVKHACGDATVDLEMSRTQRLSRDLAFESELTGLPESWRTQAQWACQFGGNSQAAAVQAQSQTEPQRQPQPQPQSNPWSWQGRAWAQGSRYPAGAIDLTSIGSKWTVRGHQPRQSLSGQGAVVVRQELITPGLLSSSAASLRAFVGLDYGRIHQTTEGSAGRRELAGLALGLRWQWAASVGELTAARAILKSDESARTLTSAATSAITSATTTTPTAVVAYGNLSFSF